MGRFSTVDPVDKNFALEIDPVDDPVVDVSGGKFAWGSHHGTLRKIKQKTYFVALFLDPGVKYELHKTMNYKFSFLLENKY